MKKTKGYTLIELMIVVAIIGIIASILVPRIIGKNDVLINSDPSPSSNVIYRDVCGED